MSDIAAAAGLGPRGLRAAFLRHQDSTPTAYVRRVRLDRAHRGLADTDPRRHPRHRARRRRSVELPAAERVRRRSPAGLRRPTRPGPGPGLRGRALPTLVVHRTVEGLSGEEREVQPQAVHDARRMGSAPGISASGTAVETRPSGPPLVIRIRPRAVRARVRVPDARARGRRRGPRRRVPCSPSDRRRRAAVPAGRPGVGDRPRRQRRHRGLVLRRDGSAVHALGLPRAGGDRSAAEIGRPADALRSAGGTNATPAADGEYGLRLAYGDGDGDGDGRLRDLASVAPSDDCRCPDRCRSRKTCVDQGSVAVHQQIRACHGTWTSPPSSAPPAAPS